MPMFLAPIGWKRLIGLKIRTDNNDRINRKPRSMAYGYGMFDATSQTPVVRMVRMAANADR